jgi:thioredoxin 1
MDILAKDFEAETSQGLVLVKFGAVWCGPCKALNPVLEELQAETSNVKFCSIDIDSDGGMDLAKQMGVAGVPTMFFIKDGQVMNTYVGNAKKSTIKEMLEGLSA